MKKYMHMKKYCDETGFPLRTMQILVKSKYSKEFSFRCSDKVNSPVQIDTVRFEEMLRERAFEGVIK